MGIEEVKSRDNVVIKSPNDRRSYRILHLPNGLCAILVHDPEIYPDGAEASRTSDDALEYDDMDEDEDEDEDEEDDDEDDDEEEEDEDEGIEKKKKGKGAAPTKKAAAAMCVGMGSFSDPSNAQGLAHFLEHMLFMGSSDFPDENEYDSFLSKHGGSSNAYTETEHTCYHFEVNREYLKGALKRFSRFFVSPLVKAEAMEREVLAVDSEFNQVLQSDSCRLQQVQCHTSIPSHPFNRFCWGNKKSLVDAMENGINLREEILKLYRENYHGGMMKLAVIGGEPLDILEEWVTELFSDVRKGHQSKMSSRNDMPVWKPGKFYRLEAVKDVHILELSWSLPCLHKEYLKKPEDYISHLMGHEGRGSLLSYLKAKGWASSLAAGVGDDGMCRSSFAYVFVMTIHLTDSGLGKIPEVISVVYQYIKLLRQSAPQEWIFKELQDIGNMEFRFAEEQPQDDYAAELSENLLFYSEDHIIYGEYAFEQWDPKLIESVLSFFTPDHMRIDILSKSFDKKSQAIQYEPWFGSPYTEEDVPPSLLEAWKNPSELDPSLHFPLKNEFIPCDFSLRNADISKFLSSITYPKCIIDQPLVKFWYKIDTAFNVPRANTYFLITLKDGYSSVKNCVLTEMFVNLLKDELNEILYQAGVAKLETSLSIVGDSLELKLYGFNDKLSTLLAKILTLSKSFSPKLDRFEVIKEDMERSYRNANIKPSNHSTYLRLQVLRECFWDVDDKLACLVNLPLSDLEAFIPTLLSQLHIEGLCHGNLSEEEAVNISEIFATIFPVKPLPVELRHQTRVLQLPSGANLVRSVCVKNELEVNSIAELYFQIEQDKGREITRLRAITDLFSNIVEEPCFNQLRTKEQLGYVVESGPRMTYRVLGFCFRVQSSEYGPLHLHRRIQNFMNNIPQLLDELDDESYENHRTGLIAEKLEKDPSLSYETGHYWNQITCKRKSDGTLDDFMLCRMCYQFTVPRAGSCSPLCMKLANFSPRTSRYLFDMSKLEAEELRTIQKADVINWYNTYLRLPSPKCRQLAVHVWGCNASKHEGVMKSEEFGKVIENVDSFKRGSEFYSSLC